MINKKYNNWLIWIIAILWVAPVLMLLSNALEEALVEFPDNIVINADVIINTVCFLTVLLAVILFCLRKKTGWILLVGCWLLGIFGFAWRHFLTFKYYFGRLYIADSDVTNDILYQRAASSLYLSLLWVSLGILFNCVLLWLICRKNIRNRYNVRSLTAILTFAITIVCCCLLLLGNSIFKSVSLKQTESNYPVVIWKSSKTNSISHIEFDLCCEIKQQRLSTTKLSRADYAYREGEYDLIGAGAHAMLYSFHNDTLEYVGNENKKRFLSLKPYPYVVKVTKPVDTIPELQNRFQPYIDKMLHQGKDSLHIESIQQLKESNPQLINNLLEGSYISIDFSRNGEFYYNIFPVEVK